MPHPRSALSRRRFLGAAAAAAFAAADFPRSQPPPREDRPRKKLAVVTTAYYYLSHAYHIGGRFLHGYLRDGRMHYPDFAVAGMYVAQQKDGDLSRELSKKHGFPLYPDPAGALTLGGDRLAVDGVLLIGEHGDYPFNARAQKLYPRFELFQKIVEVFKKSGRGVPVFC
ncbi:MAG TPA: twin-arginine translocation signal domain-containing protein, partial [Gemmataceae bacterium]|nr:twin-arginine translocation signal domain-containing protein [Gemmataceae bacterium]